MCKKRTLGFLNEAIFSNVTLPLCLGGVLAALIVERVNVVRYCVCFLLLALAEWNSWRKQLETGVQENRVGEIQGPSAGVWGWLGFNTAVVALLVVFFIGRTRDMVLSLSIVLLGIGLSAPPLTLSRGKWAEVTSAFKIAVLSVCLGVSIHSEGLNLRPLIGVIAGNFLIQFACRLGEDLQSLALVWFSGCNTLAVQLGQEKASKMSKLAIGVGYFVALMFIWYGQLDYIDAFFIALSFLLSLLNYLFHAINGKGVQKTLANETIISTVLLVQLEVLFYKRDRLLGMFPIVLLPLGQIGLHFIMSQSPVEKSNIEEGHVPQGPSFDVNRKIIICGGGVGGLVMAACFEQMGVPYLILEKREKGFVEDGADLGLWPSAIKALKILGVPNDVWKNTHRVSKMRMIVADTKEEIKAIDLEEVVEGSNEGFLMVTRSVLMDPLRRLVPDKKIMYGATVTGINRVNDGVSLDVSTKNGNVPMQAALVVGADGTYSVCRKHINPNTSVDFQGEVCYRGVVRTGKLPKEVRATFSRIGSHEMELMIGDKIRYSIGHLSEDRETGYWFVKQQCQVPARELTDQQMKEHVSSWPSDLQALYGATEESKRYMHSVEDAKMLDYWSRGVVVILGDAAHPVTPNSGQGACLAIDDAVMLSTLIRRYLTEKGKYVDALYLYEKRRKLHAGGVATEARLQMKIAHLSKTFGANLRNFILRKAPAKAIQKRLRSASMVSMEDIIEEFLQYRAEGKPLLAK